MAMPAGGLVAIAVTPLDESGAIDPESLARLMDFYLSCGSSGVAILGVMGEANRMTDAESKRVVDLTVEAVNGRVPIIVGVSNPALARVKDLSEHAAALGCAGVLVQPTPGLQGDASIASYFAAVGNALGPDIPICVQDFPKANGVHISLGTWRMIVETCPTVVMLKAEEEPGLTKLSAIRSAEADGMRPVTILTGNNGILLPQELTRGADGAMTGFAFPDVLAQVITRSDAGEFGAAEDLFDTYLAVNRYEPEAGDQRPQRDSPSPGGHRICNVSLSGWTPGLAHSSRARSAAGAPGGLHRSAHRDQNCLMGYDLVVRNGRVVHDGDVSDLDVGVNEGRISALGRNLEAGATDIDAAGQLVMPGGVDSHVHLGQLSSKGDMTADDFWTGSVSAAHGGTTTVVPFAAQHRDMWLGEVVDAAMKRAATQMTIDYGFHAIVTDPEVEGFDRDLAAIAEKGLVGIKIYLTYDRLRIDGRRALALMTAARGLGLSVMVHAEDDGIVGWGRDQALASGELGAMSHARSHSRPAERAGVATAIALAEESGATVVLAHLSTPDAVEQVMTARNRGVAVVAETCPHYLVLDETRMEAPMEQAAAFMCSPPLRGRREVDAMIRTVVSGNVHIVASDHSPYTTEQKLPAGPKTPFTDVANGLPGIELRLPLLYTAAVEEGNLTIPDFVALVATNPAITAGMYPRKGSLEVGADADVVIWDATPSSTSPPVTWERAGNRRSRSRPRRDSPTTRSSAWSRTRRNMPTTTATLARWWTRRTAPTSWSTRSTRPSPRAPTS